MISTRYARPSYMPKYWPVPSSCVLYLEGQQDAKSATIRDLSGKGNHGAITGATWKRLPSGLWYLDCDGNDDFVTITRADLNFTTQAFTIKFWTRPDVIAAYGGLFFRGAGGASGYFLQQTDPGQLVFYTVQGAANQATSSAANKLIIAIWQQVIVTRNGASVRLYRNGADAVQSAGTHIDPSTCPYDAHWGVDNNHNGDVDGGLALLEVNGSVAWSAAQCLGSFRQERHLFGI